MKTSLDVLDILFSHIKNIAGLSTAISGGIYKLQRPLNSDKEDIVINTLPTNRADVQESILNINIYVPNILPTIPNTKRMKTIYGLVKSALEDYWDDKADYTFNIQQDNIFKDENEQHYLNLRVEFYSPKN